MLRHQPEHVARSQQNIVALVIATASATVIATEVASNIILTVVELRGIVLIAGRVGRVVVVHIVRVVPVAGVGGLVGVAVDETLTAGRAAAPARAAANVVNAEV